MGRKHTHTLFPAALKVMYSILYTLSYILYIIYINCIRHESQRCRSSSIGLAVNTHTHTHPWEDQRGWHRMTRMTRPDCAVMCNLINTHTHTHTHIHTEQSIHKLNNTQCTIKYEPYRNVAVENCSCKRPMQRYTQAVAVCCC